MSRAHGFTLIEVLVALIIVAFGMGAVLATLAAAADSTARLREKSLAEWIALNQVSTVRLALDVPQTGDTTQDIEYAGRQWHWRQHVEKTNVPGLLRINVDVRAAPEEGARKVDDAKADWLASAAGFRGDAIAAATGQSVDWTGQSLQPAQVAAK